MFRLIPAAVYPRAGGGGDDNHDVIPAQAGINLIVFVLIVRVLLHCRVNEAVHGLHHLRLGSGEANLTILLGNLNLNTRVPQAARR
jgi:hypothetical protein